MPLPQLLVSSPTILNYQTFSLPLSVGMYEYNSECTRHTLITTYFLLCFIKFSNHSCAFSGQVMLILMVVLYALQKSLSVPFLLPRVIPLLFGSNSCSGLLKYQCCQLILQVLLASSICRGLLTLLGLELSLVYMHCKNSVRA